MRFIDFVENKVEDYFNPAVLSSAMNQSSKSRELLVDMSIDDFLNLAEEGHSPSKESGVSSLMSQGVKFDSVPFLGVGYSEGDPFAMQVKSHEGRHRARGLKKLGFATMPVKVIHDSIRWGGQTDPKNYDYVKNFPTHFISEDGSVKVPFKISRKDLSDRF